MYGRTLMSHPLIIDAIECCFVPVCIYNSSRGGHDGQMLRRFKERPMNYPVVRIVTHDEKELTGRISDYRSSGKLLDGMVKALEKAKLEIPEWLGLLRDEMLVRDPRGGRRLEKAAFAMSCFWSGEAKLGGIEGVHKTAVGMLRGKEVVEVVFDAQVLKYEDLVREAKKLKCATTVFARTDEQMEAARKIVKDKAVRNDESVKLALQKDQKHSMGRSPLRFVPMTDTQACRVNSALGKKKKPDDFLSPSQQKLLEIIKKHPKARWTNRIGEADYLKACAEVEKFVSESIKEK